MPNLEFQVIHGRKISQPAQGLKDALALLAQCCDTIQSSTLPDARKNSAFRIGTAIQTLLCYATPEAYRELFGDFPQGVSK